MVEHRLAKARYPSGKGEVCKAFMRRFDPGPRPQFLFRLIFAYNVSMFPTASGRKTLVVCCKRCHRDVPSGVREFPFQSIAVECPLCGELRRYLP